MNASRLSACLALLALAPRADDWPHWRGPQRDNVWRETGIMESFPTDGLKVLSLTRIAASSSATSRS